jgi:UDP-N-acetylglucosamine/UDP-N-acetylgalactosamine diphosphorylase
VSTPGVPATLQAALDERGLLAVLEQGAAAGPAARAALLRDLAAVDWAMFDRQRAALRSGPPSAPSALAPPPLAPPSTLSCPETEEAAARGWEALRAGRVALCTVAGGQASRLGFDGPKGAYPLGPVSGASLFGIMAGQVARLRQRCGVAVPWIIQTGPDNHEVTQQYFARRNWFGLGSRTVRFVCQGTLPALDPDGGFLLAAPGRLFRNPDGHGGFYRALANAGVYAELRAQGVDLLFYCQVDNPLVRMGDPAFLGHHLAAGAEMSVKVVEKTEPGEKVGLVALVDGTASCIEYSDLSDELAAERAEDGGLRFRAGNIAIHAFDLAFAERMAGSDLDLHLARKRVLALDGGLDPELRDGVKFETFVFDALPRAARAVVQMCERAEEFAPVKNRAGSDSVLTSRQALDARNRAWCAAAGEGIPAPPASGWFEFAPGLADGPADLAARRDELALACSGRLLRAR